MFDAPQIDDSLLARLPLPLNQVFRRAVNAKTPLEQHLSALYLVEVGLKLLGSAAVVEYAALARNDPQLQECLKNLARPSLGQWWEIGRRLVPILAEVGSPGYEQMQSLLLGRARDDMPRAAGLDAVLRERLGLGTGSRVTVRLSELIDRLITLRNKGPGHGAPVAHTEEFHGRMGAALLSGLAEVFGRLDVLAGRSLVYIAEVRQSAGVWLVQWLELVGPSARRLPSIEFTREDVGRLPDGDRLYIHRPGSNKLLRPLYPLIKYEPTTEEVLFLNGRHGQDSADWLCYTTGRELREAADLRSQHHALLAQLLRMNVDTRQVQAWAEKSQADEPSSELAPAAGRTLGEFELISELGRGGMGVVYRVWQPSLGRQVALKSTFRSGDAKAETRFAREIRALGRVEHPHLVRIFTSGADGDRWFYAMELVEGATLAAVCDTLSSRTSSASAVDEDTWRATVSTACTESRKAERPVHGSTAGKAAALPENGAAEPNLPVETPKTPPRSAIVTGRPYVLQIVTLMRQVTQAAQALHAAGVIHRDIKPGNIILTHSGAQVVLMDLGLAQLSDEVEGRLTRTRQFVGTLRYASPEQVLAAGRVDARSDIYSLGATMWELLTLRTLYGATEQTPTPDLMQQIQYKDPESLRRYNPAVPRDLDAIVLKCLEKNPDKRYRTAEKLEEDLACFLAGEPVVARPVRETERLWRWCRRNSLVSSLVAAVAIAVLLGLVGVAWKWHEAENALRSAETSSAIANEQRSLAERRELEAEESRYAADMRLAQQAVSDGNLGRAVSLLERYLPKPGKVDLRGFEWRYLCWACQGGSQTTYHGHTDQVNCVTFSPDGRILATASADTTVRLLDVASRQEQDSIHLEGPGVMAVDFTPDGKLLACATGNWRKSAEPGAVYLYDRNSRRIVDKLVGHKKAVNSVAISGNGALLATASEDDSTMLWQIDVSPRKQLGHFPGHSGGVNTAIFSPDSGILAAGSGDGSLQIWKVETQQVLANAIAHVSGIMSLAFSHDGKTLLIGSRDGGLLFWDVDLGKVTKTIDAKQGLIESIAFSRDGKWFATGGSNCTIALWKFDDPHDPVIFRGHRDMVYTLAFSPTEPLLASGSIDRTVKFWKWDQPDNGTLVSQDAAAAGVDFSHDGKLLAVAEGASATQTEQHSGSVSLWRLEDQQPRDRSILAGHHDLVTSVAFSPDGSLLASGSKDRTAILWDVSRKQTLATFDEHQAQVNSVRFSFDGSLVATASRDSTIKLWSTRGQSHASLKTLVGHGGWVRSVAFSPDGRLLASASSDRTVHLWDLARGTTIATLPGFQGACNSVAFSPDGTLLAAGGNDRTIRLWPVEAGTIRPEAGVVLQGYAAAINAVAFSPNGKTLAAGSQDSTTTLWNVSTREEVTVIAGQRGGILCVAFAPDGQLLVAGSNDQTVRFYRAVKSLGGQEQFGANSLWSTP
jgi:WD40 repeat protein/serine/threonine protein kinase